MKSHRIISTILLILIFIVMPNQVVFSQTGGGYTCGHFQWLNVALAGSQRLYLMAPRIIKVVGGS